MVILLLNLSKRLFFSGVGNQHMTYSRVIAILLFLSGLLIFGFYGQVRLDSDLDGGALERKSEIEEPPKKSRAQPESTADDAKDSGKTDPLQIDFNQKYSESEFQARAEVLAAQASSSEQVYGLIDSARSRGFEQVAEELEIQLHHRCDAISSGRLADWHDRGSEGYQRLTRYCDGYAGVSTTIAGDVTAAIDHSHGPPAFSKVLRRYKSQFLDLIDRARTGSEEDVFLEYVAQAESPLELHGAKLGIRTWATERNRTFRILDETRMGSLDDMIRLQQAAIDMYSCGRFFDCGATSIKAIEACLAVGVNCEPGQGYLDIVYPHYTPYEMETILAIVDRIHAHPES